MLDKMTTILEDTVKSPSIIKIENGKKLATNKNLTKELITINLENDEIEYEWECAEFERKIYGQAYSIKGMNYKIEVLKEKLWKIPMWRAFIKVVHKLKS